MLKDFPKNAGDVEALMRHGLERLHGVFLVEEVFARDLDDDDEEEEARQAAEA